MAAQEDHFSGADAPPRGALSSADGTLDAAQLRMEQSDGVEGVPLVVVAQGRPLSERMAKARIDEEDILSAGRERRGLERMDPIEYAILERNGAITVIPTGG